MKKEIFDQYVKVITEIFHITTEDMFSKSKKVGNTDARHMLYFVCKKRQMRIAYIQKFMSESGYDVKHSTIIRGIDSVVKKISGDKDYNVIINKIETSI